MGSELVAKDDSPVIGDIQPTAPPNAVSSISGYATTCNNFSVCNFVATWSHSNPNTVTYYELYKSEPSTGVCPPRTLCLPGGGSSTWTKIYNGNASTFTVTSTADYVSFKVRACNAIGCSAYSPIKRVDSIINDI